MVPTDNLVDEGTYGSSSAASFWRTMAWNLSTSVRASTSMGTRASMAATVTASGFRPQKNIKPLRNGDIRGVLRRPLDMALSICA